MNAELPGIDHVDEVCKELEKKIDAVQEATKGHLKAAKVNNRELQIIWCRYICYEYIFLQKASVL